MDLRQHRSTVTNVQRGVPHEGKFLGRYYIRQVAGKALNKAHVSAQGRCVIDDLRNNNRRFPVVEIDGKAVVVNSRTEHLEEVEICTKCAHLEDIDLSWRADAACLDADQELFFNPARTQETIAAYCDQCPVIRACFEYAAAEDGNNAGAVWGGVYFSTSRGQRRSAIEKQREKLG